MKVLSNLLWLYIKDNLLFYLFLSLFKISGIFDSFFPSHSSFLFISLPLLPSFLFFFLKKGSNTYVYTSIQNALISELLSFYFSCELSHRTRLLAPVLWHVAFLKGFFIGGCHRMECCQVTSFIDCYHWLIFRSILKHLLTKTSLENSLFIPALYHHNCSL